MAKHARFVTSQTGKNGFAHFIHMLAQLKLPDEYAMFGCNTGSASSNLHKTAPPPVPVLRRA